MTQMFVVNLRLHKFSCSIFTVEYSQNQFSLVAKLKINTISLNHSGTYMCRGVQFDETSTTDEIDIKVAGMCQNEVVLKDYLNKI